MSVRILQGDAPLFADVGGVVTEPRTGGPMAQELRGVCRWCERKVAPEHQVVLPYPAPDTEPPWGTHHRLTGYCSPGSSAVRPRANRPTRAARRAVRAAVRARLSSQGDGHGAAAMSAHNLSVDFKAPAVGRRVVREAG